MHSALYPSFVAESLCFQNELDKPVQHCDKNIIESRYV